MQGFNIKKLVRKLLNNTILLMLIMRIFINSLFSQYSIKHPFKTNVFIPDSGQLVNYSALRKKSLFGNVDEKIFFDKTHICFTFAERIVKQDEKENDPDAGEVEIKPHHVYLVFEKSQPKKIQALYPISSYYTFGEKHYEHIRFKGYEILKYEEMYKGVDAYFRFPDADSNGLCYYFKVHPLSDYQQIEMRWKNITSLEVRGSDLVVKTKFGEIKNYSLRGYYSSDHSPVKVRWKILSKDKVGFEAEEYRSNDTLVIDPWIVTPSTLTNNQRAYDVDYDKYGNVYVQGGYYPYKLAKYDVNGTLLWTFTWPAGFSSSFQFYSEHSIIRQSGSIYI